MSSYQFVVIPYHLNEFISIICNTPSSRTIILFFAEVRIIVGFITTFEDRIY